jgi:hypothetical protein
MRQNGLVLDLSCPTIKGNNSASRVQDDTLAAFWDLTVNNLLNQTFKIYEHQSTFCTFPKILVEAISEVFKF